MKLHPRVTRAGVELVKRFEGYRRHAAKLSDGGFVLGYGHTLTARQGAEVNEADAETLLWFDLSRTAEAVESAVMAPVSDPQFEALTSFAFNIGLDNFTGSTVLSRLNEGAYLQAAAAIELWRRAEFDGDAWVVDALVRRRAAEKAHFLTPPEGFAPAPTGVIRPTFDHSVLAAAIAWGERGEATVVTAPALDGDEATATLADPPGREHGDGAPSAAIAAMDALSARLGAILPDAEPAIVAPLVLAPEPSPQAPPPEPEPEPSLFGSGLDLPPPPVAAQPAPPREAADPAYAPAAPPPVRAFAFEPLAPVTSSAASAFEPLSPVEPAAAAFEPSSISARPAFATLPAIAAGAPTLFQSRAAAEDDVLDGGSIAEDASANPRPPSEPVLENPLFFLVLGLVGVALFAGAVVCMFRHPSLLCLLSGLAGVLAIAPAAAFFLFRLIGTPVAADAAPLAEAAALAAPVDEIATVGAGPDEPAADAPSKAG